MQYIVESLNKVGIQITIKINSFLHSHTHAAGDTLWLQSMEKYVMLVNQAKTKIRKCFTRQVVIF